MAAPAIESSTYGGTVQGRWTESRKGCRMSGYYGGDNHRIGRKEQTIPWHEVHKHCRNRKDKLGWAWSHIILHVLR
jgi:hypothetical protein